MYIHRPRIYSKESGKRRVRETSNSILPFYVDSPDVPRKSCKSVVVMFGPRLPREFTQIFFPTDPSSLVPQPALSTAPSCGLWQH
ncbi:hypothetical protein Mapa_006281 [Marchantia paleacea]|nr:hypothetical protein Mapa_006281 [Marchantia paleacea]